MAKAPMFSIDQRRIGDNNTTFIIAEIGQNHQGNVEEAKKLIQAAKESGADCVKFQKTDVEEKFNKNALSRPYNGEHSWGKTYGEHKQYLEFSNDDFELLQAFAKELEILFTASAMDALSLDYLVSIDVPFIKIGSGDANNFPLLRRAASTFKPLIISTGMQEFITVKYVYDIVKECHSNFCLMHCVSSYPTPIEDINLNVIKAYRNEFHDVVIGYSGHELGIDLSVCAVALGAKVIERHLTLDKTQKGTDHACSLLPQEFQTMVHKIRQLEVALGSSNKRLQPSEKDCYDKLGKTIVFAVHRQKGHVLRDTDLKIKVAEPKGIDGALFNSVIGKQLNVNVRADESLLLSHLIN